MRRSYLSAAAALFVSFGASCPSAQAAHLYAAVNGAIQVYDVAANGSLRFRQAVPTGTGIQAGTVPAMATTPGGRFLYTSSFGWITEYAALDNGRLEQWFAPTKVCEIEGTYDLAIHPTTGDYLYTVATSGCAYRTGDRDGRLTFSSQYGVGTDGYRIVAHPSGSFLLALCSERGSLVSIRTNPDGTVIGEAGRFGVPAGLFGYTFALTADSRFVYVGAVPDEPAPASGSLLVVALAPDGSMRQVNALTVPITRWDYQRLLALRGTFLAASAGGPGSRLDIYAVANAGSMRLVSGAPIEVYAMATGTGPWASYLWVATDDGIVTYSLGADGSLTRIAKAMVNGAGRLTFGSK